MKKPEMITNGLIVEKKKELPVWLFVLGFCTIVFVILLAVAGVSAIFGDLELPSQWYNTKLRLIESRDKAQDADYAAALEIKKDGFLGMTSTNQDKLDDIVNDTTERSEESSEYLEKLQKQVDYYYFNKDDIKAALERHRPTLKEFLDSHPMTWEAVAQ